MDWLFGMEPGEPISISLETAGFESPHFVHNLGTIALFISLYFVQLAFSRMCSNSCIPSVEEFGRSWWRRLVFGSMTALIVESYFVLAVSCLLNLVRMIWGSFGEVCMSLLSIGCFVLLIGFPVGYYCFLRKYFEFL